MHIASEREKKCISVHFTYPAPADEHRHRYITDAECSAEMKMDTTPHCRMNKARPSRIRSSTTNITKFPKSF